MQVTFNGIERIGKQYYSGITNKYLKSIRDEETIRKFSFPSFTTHNGQKLAQLIRQFKHEDLFAATNTMHSRYRRIAELLVKNYEEYRGLIELHSLKDENNIAIINNHAYSLLAHALASNITHRDYRKIIPEDFYLLRPNRELCFFLISKDVRRTLTEPLRTHEVYASNEPISDTISDDYVNYFTKVNNYYRQIYLWLAHTSTTAKTPVIIEVDMSDVNYITKTCDTIRRNLDSWLDGGKV